MVDQDLINKSSDLLERIVIGQVQAESVCDELVRMLNEMNGNYCQLIEDNAEMHKEIARINHLNAHLNKQVEQICNEENKGAFGDTFTTYILTSTNHEKIVRATKNRGFKNGKVIPAKGFRARNECNGSSFEKDRYQ